MAFKIGNAQGFGVIRGYTPWQVLSRRMPKVDITLSPELGLVCRYCQSSLANKPKTRCLDMRMSRTGSSRRLLVRETVSRDLLVISICFTGISGISELCNVVLLYILSALGYIIQNKLGLI